MKTFNLKRARSGQQAGGFTLIELLVVTAISAILAATLCACGSKESTVKAQVDPKAFDTAAPEAKQIWGQALTAAAQNDLGSAIMTLRLMSRQPISQDQQKTVYEAIVFYEGKLRQNAKGGDPVARKTIEVLGISQATPDN